MNCLGDEEPSSPVKSPARWHTSRQVYRINYISAISSLDATGDMRRNMSKRCGVCFNRTNPMTTSLPLERLTLCESFWKRHSHMPGSIGKNTRNSIHGTIVLLKSIYWSVMQRRHGKHLGGKRKPASSN